MILPVTNTLNRRKIISRIEFFYILIEKTNVKRNNWKTQWNPKQLRILYSNVNVRKKTLLHSFTFILFFFHVAIDLTARFECVKICSDKLCIEKQNENVQRMHLSRITLYKSTHVKKFSRTFLPRPEQKEWKEEKGSTEWGLMEIFTDGLSQTRNPIDSVHRRTEKLSESSSLETWRK